VSIPGDLSGIAATAVRANGTIWPARSLKRLAGFVVIIECGVVSSLVEPAAAAPTGGAWGVARHKSCLELRWGRGPLTSSHGRASPRET
jgi:hypothetical protein